MMIDDFRLGGRFDGEDFGLIRISPVQSTILYDTTIHTLDSLNVMYSVSVLYPYP